MQSTSVSFFTNNLFLSSFPLQATENPNTHVFNERFESLLDDPEPLLSNCPESESDFDFSANISLKYLEDNQKTFEKNTNSSPSISPPTINVAQQIMNVRFMKEQQRTAQKQVESYCLKKFGDRTPSPLAEESPIHTAEKLIEQQKTTPETIESRTPSPLIEKSTDSKF